MKTTKEFLDAYKKMHHNHQHAFSGFGVYDNRDELKKIVEQTGSVTALDYGAGKGWQYTDKGFRWDKIDKNIKLKFPSYLKEVTHVNRSFGIKDENIDWYDPGIRYPDPHRKLKNKKYDGVICIDVMEHVPLQEIDNVLFNIYTRAEKFTFLSIAARPAKKKFEDGTNVHVSVYRPEWWKTRIVDMARWTQFDGVNYVLVTTGPDTNGAYGKRVFKFSITKK